MFKHDTSCACGEIYEKEKEKEKEKKKRKKDKEREKKKKKNVLMLTYCHTLVSPGTGATVHTFFDLSVLRMLDSGDGC